MPLKAITKGFGAGLGGLLARETYNGIVKRIQARESKNSDEESDNADGVPADETPDARALRMRKIADELTNVAAQAVEMAEKAEAEARAWSEGEEQRARDTADKRREDRAREQAASQAAIDDEIAAMKRRLGLE